MSRPRSSFDGPPRPGHGCRLVSLRASRNCPKRTFAGDLREAVERHILVPLDSGAGEAFVFRHALLQEAIYGELLPGERARLHGRFAAALADANPAIDDQDAAELAYHWYAAHDLPHALEASVRTGVAALRMNAFADAHAHFERALELWDRVSDASQRAGLDRIELLELAARTAARRCRRGPWP